MSTELRGLREQIKANACLMVCPPTDNAPSESSSGGGRLPTLGSVATLVNPNATRDTSSAMRKDMDIVVFGDGNQFTAAVMNGVQPFIEGATSTTPEGAMRRLLLATCELLNTVMPKLGSHQRNIHGGGVVDEDLLSKDLLEAQKKIS